MSCEEFDFLASRSRSQASKNSEKFLVSPISSKLFARGEEGGRGFLSNLVYGCILMRRCVMRKVWISSFKVKVTGLEKLLKFSCPAYIF